MAVPQNACNALKLAWYKVVRVFGFSLLVKTEKKIFCCLFLFISCLLFFFSILLELSFYSMGSLCYGGHCGGDDFSGGKTGGSAGGIHCYCL